MYLEDYLTIIYTLLSLAVVITYINHRYIRMQTTIAIMVASLLLSFVVILLGSVGYMGVEVQIAKSLEKLQFHELLMKGLLGLLLFAGALNVDINSLKEYKWEIITLSCVTTLASSFLIGIVTYYILLFTIYPLDFTYCLLFGALISPTDPIAVLNICREINAPKMIRACVSGESLFNDGVGIVLFLSIYGVTFGDTAPTVGSFTLLFIQEVFGGILYGIGIGILGYKLIKPIDDHKVAILITLAIATGGFTLANLLHISGPLSMVVAGLFIGNKGKGFKISGECRDHLFTFWEVLDELLIALLFILVGFELLTIPDQASLIIPCLLAIFVALGVRFITVSIPLQLFKLQREYVPHMVKIMVWGGLRGGLAVALALSLPAGVERNIIIAMTYAVVIFSIIVQGITIKPLITRSNPS